MTANDYDKAADDADDDADNDGDDANEHEFIDAIARLERSAFGGKADIDQPLLANLDL
jgi:hypothetical protein